MDKQKSSLITVCKNVNTHKTDIL